MSRAQIVWARRLMHWYADQYRSVTPLGVSPSRGKYGSAQDWDTFTSMCDARAALVFALGGVPDPLTGHRVHAPVNVEPEQLSLWGAA